MLWLRREVTNFLCESRVFSENFPDLCKVIFLSIYNQKKSFVFSLSHSHMRHTEKDNILSADWPEEPWQPVLLSSEKLLYIRVAMQIPWTVTRTEIPDKEFSFSLISSHAVTHARWWGFSAFYLSASSFRQCPIPRNQLFLEFFENITQRFLWVEFVKVDRLKRNSVNVTFLIKV